MPFDPIPQRESAVGACERSLRAAILSGRIAPGEKLPTERHLSESFGVNRVTVRSALAHLAHAGLVSVRQGSGYVVRDFRRVGGPELLPALAELGQARVPVVEIARDLLSVRRALACVVLEALVAHIEPKGADGVDAAIDRFEATVAADGELDAVARADLDVVAALVDATGRPTLALCLNPISQVLESLPALRNAMFADPSSNVAGWHALAAWLRVRTPRGVATIERVLAARDDATVERLGTSRVRNRKARS